MSELALHEMDENQLDDARGKAYRAIDDKTLLFVRSILRGEHKNEAYQQAGYTARTQNSLDAGATRKLNQVKVQRILNIEREITARVEGVTKDWLIRKQIQLGKTAEKAGDPATAKQCFAEVTKMLDHYPAQKTEHTHNHKGGIALNTITTDQWVELLKNKPAKEHVQH